MEVVTTIGGLAGFVWMAALARYFLRWSFSPVVIGAFASIIVGTVFGAAFFSIDQGPIPLTFDRMLLLLVFGGFVLRCLLFYESVRPFDRIDFAVLSLLVVIVLSTFTHDWSYRDQLPLSRLLFYYLLPTGVYFAVKNSRVSDRDVTIVLTGFALFGIYLSLTAFAETQEWTWAIFPSYISDPNVVEFFGRGRGPLHNPVINGTQIIVGLCCSLLLLFQSQSVWIRRLALLSIPVALLGSFSTLTRIVWLSTVAVLFVIGWARSNHSQRVALTAFGVVSCILLAIVVQSGVVNAFKRDKYVTVEETSKSTGLRVIFFVIAMDMFEDRPIFGHGFAQYPQARFGYLKGNHQGVETIIGKDYIQHNIILAYLTEMGLIGVMALLFLLAVFLSVGLKVYRDRKVSMLKRQAGLLLVLLLICYFLNGMAQDVTLISMCNMMLFFVAGIVGSIYSARTEHMPTFVPNTGRVEQSGNNLAR